MGQVEACCESASHCLSNKDKDIPRNHPDDPVQILDDGFDGQGARSMRSTGYFRVNLSKAAAGRLGLDVEHAEDSPNLPIVAVTGGAAEAWNQANPQRLLRPGDAIVEVNGHRGRAPDLLAACKRDAVLDMMVVREAVPALIRHHHDA